MIPPVDLGALNARRNVHEELCKALEKIKSPEDYGIIGQIESRGGDVLKVFVHGVGDLALPSSTTYIEHWLEKCGIPPSCGTGSATCHEADAPRRWDLGEPSFDIKHWGFYEDMRSILFRAARNVDMHTYGVTTKLSRISIAEEGASVSG